MRDSYCGCDEIVGVINNKERSKYNHYTKAESDLKFADKSRVYTKEETLSKSEIEAIKTAILHVVENKADNSLLQMILEELNKKALSSDVIEIAQQIAMKADRVDVVELIRDAVAQQKETTDEIISTIDEFKTEYAAETKSLDERISELENAKPPIEIESISINPKTAERGSSVSPVVSWTLSRDEKSADLNGVDVKGLRSYAAYNVTAATDYQLTVTDEKDRSATAKVSISFINRIYWGVSSDSSLTEAKVKSLKNNTLSDTKSRTISIDATDQFVYYALPKRLGTVTFRLGQFIGGFEDPVTLQVTNQQGYAEEYYIYRSSQQYTAKVDFVVS